MMKLSRHPLSRHPFYSISTLVLMLFIHPLAAQQAQSGLDSIQAPLPEEINITGNLSFKALRAQAMQAEVDMYTVFNTINDDKAFIVTCNKTPPLGTRIPIQQSCHPNYYYDATGDEGAAMLREMRGESSFRDSSGGAKIAQYNEFFEEKIKQAVRESPEFVQAIINFNELNNKLKAKRSNSAFAD